MLLLLLLLLLLLILVAVMVVLLLLLASDQRQEALCPQTQDEFHRCSRRPRRRTWRRSRGKRSAGRARAFPAWLAQAGSPGGRAGRDAEMQRDLLCGRAGYPFRCMEPPRPVPFRSAALLFPFPGSRLGCRRTVRISELGWLESSLPHDCCSGACSRSHMLSGGLAVIGVLFN